MSQALPADLFHPSTPDLNRASENDVDLTSPEELHRFWKIYDAQKDYVDDPSILRLRNLFWRIWSSDRLAKSISNERLNQFWLRYRREHVLLPFNIPASFAQQYGLDPLTGGPIVEASGTRSRPQSPAGADERPPLPTRLSETARGGSSSNSTANGESSRPGVRRTTSGNRNRPAIVAGGGRGRTRPGLPRRRSSQTRLQHADATRPSQPGVRSPAMRAGSQENRQDPSGSGLQRPTNEPAFALPPSSWQSVDESNLMQMSSIEEDARDRTGSLVDRNFRTKFLSSATNLPAMARMRNTGSVVRFADEEGDTDKGKGKEAATPESPERPRSWRRTNSQVFDSDDSDDVQLPRTTSQLSLAIRDRRKQSGSRDLGPVPGADAASGKQHETRRKEEEVLKMGRSAAAPRIPKGLKGTGQDVGYRSPSPAAPTF